MANYPSLPNYLGLTDQVAMVAQLQHERGAQGITPILARAADALRQAIEELQGLPIDEVLAQQEPNDLASIRALRPQGPRRIWPTFDSQSYARHIEGALLGRFAGCTLGAPVEYWKIERMAALAAESGDPFPPTNYWRYIPEPKTKRYGVNTRESYTRDKMAGVPVDDDLMYTILGLLIVEQYGAQFTTADVAQAWLKYLPWTWDNYVWANLQADIPVHLAGERNNPKQELINASIRADPWGYLAPGWPERAAELAWRDAYLSHRRNGVYAAMFFAASISAALAIDDPLEALRIGLTEIPAECALAEHLRWAIETAPRIEDYREARQAIDERFGPGDLDTMYVGMHSTHSINNTCCTVMGLVLGGRDFTRVIGQTVAMGMDNDCTAATAGSIVGAVLGREGIPEHWHMPFLDMVHSYLIGEPHFRIGDLVARFGRQAAAVWKD